VRWKTFITVYSKYTRTINTKFYQNRPHFVDDVTKNIWRVLGSLTKCECQVLQGSVATLFRWAG